MSMTYRWLRVVGPVAIFLPIILACPTRPVETPKPNQAQQTNRYFPQSIEKDVDMLFIVDNSNSMEQEQANLAKQFPSLIEALRSPKLGVADPKGSPCTSADRRNCRIPNVHIGVVSSDLGAGNYSLPSCEVAGGDGGKLRNAPMVAGCTPPKDPYISYVDGLTNVSTTGKDGVEQVKDAFGCIALLGTGGCGFEHQIESARRALDPTLNVNPGFIRKDAFLAVVWITDEDDCSAKKPQLFDPAQQGLTDPLGPLQSFRCTEFGISCDKNGRQPGVRHNCVPGFDWLFKVEDYQKFFAGLKPPGRVILFAIAGPTEPFEVGTEGPNPVLKPSCQSSMGFAVPAVRLASLVKSFGDTGHFNKGLNNDTPPKPIEVNICSTDFTPAMKLLGEVIVATLGGQCISAPPLTKTGAIACQAGDDLGTNTKGAKITCANSCLDKVDCIIEEKTNQGTSAEKSVVVEKCPAEMFDPKVTSCGSNCPCWRIVKKAATDCTGENNGSPYGLQILRVGEAPKGAVAVARCATSPLKWGSAPFADLNQCN